MLYQIYFALDLGALKSVMVMFTSLWVAHQGVGKVGSHGG